MYNNNETFSFGSDNIDNGFNYNTLDNLDESNYQNNDLFDDSELNYPNDSEGFKENNIENVNASDSGFETEFPFDHFESKIDNSQNNDFSGSMNTNLSYETNDNSPIMSDIEIFNNAVASGTPEVQNNEMESDEVEEVYPFEIDKYQNIAEPVENNVEENWNVLSPVEEAQNEVQPFAVPENSTSDFNIDDNESNGNQEIEKVEPELDNVVEDWSIPSPVEETQNEVQPFAVPENSTSDFNIDDNESNGNQEIEKVEPGLDNVVEDWSIPSPVEEAQNEVQLFAVPENSTSDFNIDDNEESDDEYLQENALKVDSLPTFDNTDSEEPLNQNFNEISADNNADATIKEDSTDNSENNNLEESNQIEISDTPIEEINKLTEYDEDNIESTNINSLFDRVSVNVKEASDIFRKNTEMKEKIDSKFKDLKELQSDIEIKKKNQMEEINSYKDEVFSKLTEKKEEIEKRLNLLKEKQAAFEKEKSEFEEYRRSEIDNIDRIKKEVQSSYDERREELSHVEDVLRKQKDILDSERNQLSLDRIQYEADKNELANNLLKFNELVDQFTNSVNSVPNE